MSPVARAGGVALSLLAHVAVGAALLTLSVTDWSPPLFVDLVERGESPGVPPAAAPSTPGPAARPHQRSARAGASAPRAAAAPARAAPPVTSARPAPPAPLAPSAEPVPPSPPAQAAPLAPPAAVAPPVLADSSPAPLAPPSPPASSAPAASASPVAPARGGAAEGLPGARAGGETRGDAPSAPIGPPGSSLALGSPGAGAGAIPAEYGPYLQRFRQRVQESLVYPLAARRQGLRGTVELDVWLDPAGRVRDVRVARSSSHDLLDEAAVETIRGLGPLPFPDSLPRRSLRIRLPLVFDLR
jgi:TonB family protein